MIIVSLSFNTFLVLSVLKLDEGLPNFSSVVEMTSFLYLKNVNLITACLLHENRINDFVQWYIDTKIYVQKLNKVL